MAWSFNFLKVSSHMTLEPKPIAKAPTPLRTKSGTESKETSDNQSSRDSVQNGHINSFKKALAHLLVNASVSAFMSASHKNLAFWRVKVSEPGSSKPAKR